MALYGGINIKGFNMFKWSTLLISGTILLWLASGQHVRANTGSPTQIVREMVAAVGSIKTVENGALSAADTQHNITVGQSINRMLDVDSVSRRVLGRHWKNRTPKEQKKFTELMTQLLVKVAYPKSAAFFGSFDIDVTDERITGERAEVKTTVSDPKEGLISVDYRLQQNNGTWHVRDIVLDDVSLVRNLRSQCHQIITEHSYDELMRRMQEKLNE